MIDCVITSATSSPVQLLPLTLPQTHIGHVEMYVLHTSVSYTLYMSAASMCAAEGAASKHYTASLSQATTSLATSRSQQAVTVSKLWPKDK